MQTTSSSPMSRWMLACVLAVGTTACSMDKTTTPPLAGPSEYGTSINITADTDSLNRDGISQTQVHVRALDPTGKAIPNQRFKLTLSPANGGVLSEEEIFTRENGMATVLYIAAKPELPIQRVTIGVSPIGSNNDNSRTQTITIALRGANAPVLTEFGVSPTTPTQFNLVTFDASSTTLDNQLCASRCAFAWTFGNEGTGAGEVATHRFENPGTHVVTLVITGPDGVTITLRKAVVVSQAEPPTAVIVESTASPNPGVPVRFTGATSEAKGGARIVEYHWDFGNGDTATGVSVSAEFEVGTYVVVLTVKDNNGLTNSATVVITVEAPEAP